MSQTQWVVTACKELPHHEMSSHGGRTVNGIVEAVFILSLLPHSISISSNVKNKKGGAIPSLFHVVIVWCLNTDYFTKPVLSPLKLMCSSVLHTPIP
jgi:hypothetical protein